MTKTEIQRITAPRPVEGAPSAVTPPAAGGAADRPVLPAEIADLFAPATAPGPVTYRPNLHGFARLHYVDAKSKVDLSVGEQGSGTRGTRSFTIELGGAPDQSVRSPMTSAPPAVGAPEPATAVPQPDSSRPEPGPGARFAPQPGPKVAATQSPPAQSAAPSAGPDTSEPTVERPPVAAAPAPRSAAAVPAAGGGWAVQVGAFGSADAARKLVQDLVGAGYRAYVSPVQRGGKTLHRVRVGPEADKASAEQVARRLKGRGLPATVVRND